MNELLVKLFVILFAIQAIRYVIFEHKTFQPFWQKFENVPLLRTFVTCAFCQGFWLGATVYIPILGWLYGFLWSLIAGWLATSWQTWIERRRAINAEGEDKEEVDNKDKSTEKNFNKVSDDESKEIGTDEVCLLECNIDDMSGEFFGDVMQRLFNVGAVDVWFTSAYGKKNRPLYQLSAMVFPKDESKAVKEIFAHTSTAGIRRKLINRIIMDRRFIKVEVYGQTIAVKCLEWQDIIKYTPEWEDCAEASKKSGRTVADIYAMAQAEARKKDGR